VQHQGNANNGSKSLAGLTKQSSLYQIYTEILAGVCAEAHLLHVNLASGYDRPAIPFAYKSTPIATV
jgi:hypothetical protein